MKYFISQPMNGRTNEEIKAEREAIKNACFRDDEDAVIINSFFENAPVDSKPLWYLGESIKKLSEADIAYFANGWEKARGCKIEFECAKEYGITCICENENGEYVVNYTE